MILDFLPEIREEIFRLCSFDDVKNLSLTSSKHNKALRQVLFHTIRIPTQYLHNNTSLNNKQLKKRIHTLQDTEVLRLSASVFPQCTFKAISELTNLLELNLHGSMGVGDSDFSVLCNGLLGLKVVDIAFTRVSDSGLIHVKKLRGLEKLSFSNCRITNTGLSYLVTSTNLRELNASICPGITDISAITNLLSLEVLCLNYCGLVDDGISGIGNLTSLRSLVISSCYNLTDVGISYVSMLTDLKKLDVSVCCGISDVACLYISELRSLEELYLSFCKITDTGVSSLVSLAKLKILKLNECRGVSDTGVSSLVKHLVNLEKLLQ